MNADLDQIKKLKPLKSNKRLNYKNLNVLSFLEFSKMIFTLIFFGFFTPIFSNPMFYPSLSQFSVPQTSMGTLPQYNPMMSNQLAYSMMGPQMSHSASPLMTSMNVQPGTPFIGQPMSPTGGMMGSYPNQPNPYGFMSQPTYSQPQPGPTNELQEILEKIQRGSAKVKNSDDLFNFLKQSKSPSPEEILQAKTKLKYVLSKVGIFDALVSHSRLDEVTAKSSEVYLEGYMGALDDLSSKIDSVKSSHLTSFNANLYPGVLQSKNIMTPQPPPEYQTLATPQEMGQLYPQSGYLNPYQSQSMPNFMNPYQASQLNVPKMENHMKEDSSKHQHKKKHSDDIEEENEDNEEKEEKRRSSRHKKYPEKEKRRSSRHKKRHEKEKRHKHHSRHSHSKKSKHHHNIHGRHQ